MRQEQEPATEEITEVGPGVLRLQLPISMPGLGHVNCYALEDERGVALVDPGLPGPESYRALTARLAQAGVPLARVHTVIVTHSHPDHFGGAGRLRDETGAEVVGHRSLPHAGGIPPSRPTSTSRRPSADAVRALDDRGTSRATPRRVATPSRGMTSAAASCAALMSTPKPSVRLDDAEVIRLAGRDWVAVHTPGHTHDHLCLFDPAEGVAALGRPRAAHHHAPHLRDRAPTPIRWRSSSTRSTGCTTCERRHRRPARPRPPVRRPRRAGRGHQGATTTSGSTLLRKASNELGRPATVEELSHPPLLAAGLGPDGRQRDLRPPRAPAPAGHAKVTSVDGRLEYVVD